MSCLWAWCRRGRESDTDTEEKPEERFRNESKKKKKRKKFRKDGKVQEVTLLDSAVKSTSGDQDNVSAETKAPPPEEISNQLIEVVLEEISESADQLLTENEMETNKVGDCSTKDLRTISLVSSQEKLVEEPLENTMVTSEADTHAAPSSSPPLESEPGEELLKVTGSESGSSHHLETTDQQLVDDIPTLDLLDLAADELLELLELERAHRKAAERPVTLKDPMTIVISERMEVLLKAVVGRRDHLLVNQMLGLMSSSPGHKVLAKLLEPMLNDFEAQLTNMEQKEQASIHPLRDELQTVEHAPEKTAPVKQLVLEEVAGPEPLQTENETPEDTEEDTIRDLMVTRDDAGTSSSPPLAGDELQTVEHAPEKTAPVEQLVLEEVAGPEPLQSDELQTVEHAPEQSAPVEQLVLEEVAGPELLQMKDALSIKAAETRNEVFSEEPNITDMADTTVNQPAAGVQNLIMEGSVTGPKRKTRRGTRGKGRKINYKKDKEGGEALTACGPTAGSSQKEKERVP